MESNNNDTFTLQKMITCIGNKRKLYTFIEKIIETDILPKLEKQKINILDGFAGSSVISRSLSQYCNKIYSNDLEKYACVMASCFLKTPTKQQKVMIITHINRMNILAKNGPYHEGIITKNYSPKDTFNVQKDERCFYTHKNGLIIDTLRKYIDDNVEDELFDYCITPLLIKASIHTNTSGVFKGFHKKDGIGSFGGSENHALSRITKDIELDIPIWSSESFEADVFQKNINDLITELPNDIDITYYDPPYNQHPYSSNYFMLNLIIDNKMPDKISKVSGIPNNWNKSDYNYRKSAIVSMKNLINETMKKSKYLLLSYNDEGIIPLDEWNNILKEYDVKKYEKKYDTYKGSRNLKNRSNKVTEIVYLLKLK